MGIPYNLVSTVTDVVRNILLELVGSTNTLTSLMRTKNNDNSHVLFDQTHKRKMPEDNTQVQQ